jgi:hypothetical protein
MGLPKVMVWFRDAEGTAADCGTPARWDSKPSELDQFSLLMAVYWLGAASGVSDIGTPPTSPSEETVARAMPGRIDGD